MRPRRRARLSPKPCGREIVRQRLGAQFVQHASRIVHQMQPPKLALVGKAQGSPIIQGEQHADVPVVEGFSRPQHQLPGHAQMHQQRVAAAQRDHHPLTAPAHAGDRLARETMGKSSRVGRDDAVRPAHLHPNDGVSDQRRSQSLGHRFNFGQLGHSAAIISVVALPVNAIGLKLPKSRGANCDLRESHRCIILATTTGRQELPDHFIADEAAKMPSFSRSKIAPRGLPNPRFWPGSGDPCRANLDLPSLTLAPISCIVKNIIARECAPTRELAGEMLFAISAPGSALHVHSLNC